MKKYQLVDIWFDGYFLYLTISHDGIAQDLLKSVREKMAFENLIASYAMEIRPAFFQFERVDQKAFSLENLDDVAVAAWFDEKVMQFVDTYLQVDQVEQYQQGNMATDPVCGMHLNKGMAAARIEHSGHAYYFCDEGCRDKFAAEPPRYLSPRASASRRQTQTVQSRHS